MRPTQWRTQTGTRTARSGRLVALATAAALSAIASPAAAQSGRPVQDGRALDANPAVGSGGYNTTRTDFTRVNAANRYITGNVTGLGQFHGFSPVQDPSLFRAGLGSSGLTFFNRQSVSIGDVLAGRTEAGLSYYGREETIVGTGGIVAGRNRPGSSQVESRYEAPAPSQGVLRYDASPTRLRSIEQLLSDGRALQVPPAALIREIEDPTLRYDAVDYWRNAASPYALATRSSLFGLDAVRRASGERPDAALTGDGAAYGRPWERIDGALPGERGMDESGVDTPAPSGRKTPSDLMSRALPGATQSRAGQDRFADLVGALSQSGGAAEVALQAEARERARRAVLAQGDARLQQALGRARFRVTDPQATPETLRQSAAEDQLRETRAARSVVLARWDTLVGESQDPINQLLKRAEEQMRAGRHYEASQSYERAHVLAPGNPLTLLGGAHALAAAGDYQSAVARLTDAIARFPQAALLRLDLNALMGGSTVREARCKDLRALLDRRDDARLRFLLGYLEYHGGDTAAGLTDLLRAAEAAPRDEVIAAYPRLLLGDPADDTTPGAASSAPSNADQP